MGLFGIGQKFNVYGITRKERKAIEKELQEKNIDFNKAELKAAIKNNDLSSYLNNVGEDMKSVLGLSLSTKIGVGMKDKDNLAELSDFASTFNSEKVDKKDIEAALKVLEEVNIKNADKSKVKAHLKNVLYHTEANVTASIDALNANMPPVSIA